MPALSTPIVAAIFLCAMAVESAIKGFFLSINKFNQSKTPIPAIMIVSNLLSLAYGPLFILSILATEDCHNTVLAFKVVMHLFFNSFSFFLLFKTWIVSQKRFTVACAAFLLIVHRFIWAGCDWTWSNTLQTKQGCFYLQDKVAIIGITTGGLLVDVFCTCVTFWSAMRDVPKTEESTASKMSRIYRVLVADNVLRTMFVLAVNAFTLNYSMYSSLSVTPGVPTVLLLIPAISHLVYTEAINVEFFWIGVRNDIIQEVELKATDEEEDDYEQQQQQHHTYGQRQSQIRLTSAPIQRFDNDKDQSLRNYPIRNHSMSHSMKMQNQGR
ncbi:hypothetical protein CcCBS67573_g09402 [Chytriomyces confervae]|uniref:Uncharacterized protein n=1 Tax=Chytriomyces confervae TaxID=246404 RepID=A0A507DWQ9_9FUNG|nr:hypothetical protein CcCBS67573_g09402 [Chytriomyces confervae]